MLLSVESHYLQSCSLPHSLQVLQQKVRMVQSTANHILIHLGPSYFCKSWDTPPGESPFHPQKVHSQLLMSLLFGPHLPAPEFRILEASMGGLHFRCMPGFIHHFHALPLPLFFTLKNSGGSPYVGGAIFPILRYVLSFRFITPEHRFISLEVLKCSVCDSIIAIPLLGRC